MVVQSDLIQPGKETEFVDQDGRPTPTTRQALRKIPSFRNGLSLFFTYGQTFVLLYIALHFGAWTWLSVFILMGRAHAQFASLMHEAAHRLLLRDRRLNDFCGRWLIGYPVFTNTDAYRRVHMAHHRQEFGPNEPDFALYANYPISRASFRRKLVRDASGRTGSRLLREQLRGIRSDVVVVRRTLIKILMVQALLIAASIISGYWWAYPLFWLLPYLTVWRVINRLRSIAEHGGLAASEDRRITTHSVTQNWLGRFFLVPFHIGWHLAHHVDAGVPFRHLPRFHRMLIESGYINPGYEYSSYPKIWRALVTGPK